MPTVAIVAGMLIMFYYDDHRPPHFHVRGSSFVARILINDGSVLDVDGKMSVAQTRILRRWARSRRIELLENWDRAQQGAPLLKIEGLQ